MPKKPKAERGTGLPQMDEHFLQAKAHELLPGERVELRKFFESSTWNKVIHNARLSRPTTTVQVTPGITAELRAQLIIERLAELRGWKLFEVALAIEAKHPVQRPNAPKDNFPDEGLIDNPKKP